MGSLGIVEALYCEAEWRTGDAELSSAGFGDSPGGAYDGNGLGYHEIDERRQDYADGEGSGFGDDAIPESTYEDPFSDPPPDREYVDGRGG